MMKKQISIYTALLLLLFSFLLLVACTPNGDAGNSTTDGGQTSGEPVTPSDALTVFDGSGYIAAVVYPNSSGSGVGALRSNLSSALRKQFGSIPNFEKDSESASDSDRVEILLGHTNRLESARPEEYSVSDAWYFVGVSGNKIVINGANDYMLGLAVERFIADFIQPSGGELVGYPPSRI